MSDGPPVRMRVVRGNPDDLEVAAVLVALMSASGATDPAADPSPTAASRGGWGDREARLRLAVHPAPGAWRAAGRAGR